MKNIFTLFLFLFALAVTAIAQVAAPASLATLESRVMEPPCVETNLMGVFFEKETLVVAKNCRYEKPLADGATHKLWKEIYGVKDGKIVLISTVPGRVVPAKIEWVEKP